MPPSTVLQFRGVVGQYFIRLMQHSPGIIRIA
jgi:hypothetical protein